MRKILFTLLILLSVNVCYSQKKQVKNTQNSTESAFNREFSYFFLNGNKYKNFGDYQTAIKYYTQALSSDPTQASAYYEIASILVITGDYSSAVAYAEKAVQYDKTNNEAYLGLLVYAYKFNNQIEKTIPLFKKYIAQNPDEISNYFDLARIYSDVNKPKDAIKTMNSAEQRFGVLSTIIYEKFVIYEKHNDIDKAIAELERLRDAFPQDVRNKVMLANVYLQYKRMPEAEKEFKELEKMPINEGIVFLTLADYHRMVDYQYFTYFTYLEKAFLCEDESLG
ncbi:MAG: tetratricopeptide repeat protein, partial [Bacteroidales bacterium]|nr:tetratricopeptide repeat protein [Bacteroidales bacterium]